MGFFLSYPVGTIFVSENKDLPSLPWTARTRTLLGISDGTLYNENSFQYNPQYTLLGFVDGFFIYEPRVNIRRGKRNVSIKEPAPILDFEVQ